MSENHISSCVPVLESNIPIPKRVIAEARKSKGCTRLPELQKYIDTIIKASNHCDLHIESNKEKHSKEKKLGKYSLRRGFNNKLKFDKLRVDLSPRRKALNPPRTPTPEGGRREDTPCTFVSGFEDPRNWKFNKVQNSSFSLKVEKFLKELYPNPYHLDTLSEFHGLKSMRNAASREELIPEHLFPEKVGPELKPENKESITAVVEINGNDGDNLSENPDPDTGSENLTLSGQEESETHRGLTPPELNSEQTPRHSKGANRNFPTRVSGSSESPPSTTDCPHNPRKRTNLKMSRKWSSKEMLERVKSKCSSVAFGDDRPDHDIGKLMLLSRSDSDASMTKRHKESKIKKWDPDDNLKRSNSKIYKQSELSDLRKIHEVMNRANKSFFLLSEMSQNGGGNASEKAVAGDNLVEGKALDKDVGKAAHEGRGKHPTKNDRSGVDVKPKIPESKPNFDSGFTKAFGFESGFLKTLPEIPPQRNESSIGSEPDRSRRIEIQESARKISKTVLDLKQSLSNIEQRIKDKVKNDDTSTSQKIGEVLEFMYDCLMKFGTSEETPREDESSASLVQKIFSTNEFVQPSTSKLSDEAESLFRTSPQTSQNLTLLESRKRSKIRCRKSEFALQIENKQDESSPPATASADGQSSSTVNTEATTENYIPTVETHNELGGCAELATEERVPHETVRPPKPVSPIPGKLNRSRADPRNLREALETEEKLFAKDNNQKDKAEKAKSKEFLPCKVLDDSRTGESSGGLKCPNSNFVICVNSLPRNLKTFTAVTPVIAVPQCPQTAVMAVREHREIKPMACKSEFSLKEFYAATEINYQVLTCTYRLKQGSVFQMNKLSVEYIAVPVCEKVISSTPELQRESSLKNSVCFLSVSMKRGKRPPKVTKVSRSSLTVSNVPSVKSSAESGINFESEDERRVDALMEAIDDAEGKILLLQQINDSCKKDSQSTIRSCRASQTVETESLDGEPKHKGDRKKVQDLLKRTYNLQMKLQECMNKISGLHPSLRPSTSKQQQSSTDCTVYKYDKATSSETESMAESHGKRGNTYPLVHWYPVSRRHPYVDEAPSVTKVDHSTSYSPPPEKRNRKTQDEPLELPREAEKTGRNEDDDRSSVCSFKSSNEFSQDSDFSMVKKELKVPESMTKREFYKKLYSEIELIRHIFKAESRQRDHSEVRQKAHSKNDHKETSTREEANENTLVQYDTKCPSKTLKTVFKGRDSSTELTIGLKDIPMTQVKNISVEKTKLTPNHTKISICISKEKTKEVRVTNVAKEVLQSKIPTYCCKHIARTLKGGPPSEEEDEVSKSSQSVREESDDNEDDYKSVASTFEDSDPDQNSQKSPAMIEHKAAKAPVPKRVPKHRFDFYQKMNTNAESSGVKPKAVTSSVCRYKELEPLKQAMTEMQIRMRSIKRDALFNSNDYYERALKLAKMSAGYCQSCGHRAVIPNDTFGYYKALVPRRCANRGIRHYKSSVSSNPSFYSFHSSNENVGEQICDLDIKHNAYLLNRTTHSNRTILRGSLQEMPVVFERM